MGKPENGLPGRREHHAVLFVCYRERLRATGMQDGIRDSTGINIHHSTMHKILRDRHLTSKAAKEEPETRVDPPRAHLLQLHAAHGLQIARRRKVIPVL